MNLLPQASGTRPRVACEIAPEGVIAARSDAAAGPLAAVTCVTLREGAVAPGLKPGNLVDRLAIVSALRKALEDVGARPNTRNADITVVIPDGACRVLLLDFDALSNKLSEALPLVRFRLKKLVPFDADDAMVSFQIMSQSKSGVRVLAVAIPRDVLAEYESAVREAGFDPGAVLPSTLATIAAVDDSTPALLINANRLGVTTAIVRESILLLHRTVDLQADPAGTPANLPPALFEPSETTAASPLLPLVDRDNSASEWARQQPLPEHGRDPFAVREDAEAAVQNVDGITGRYVPDIYAAGDTTPQPRTEPAPVTQSPYIAPTASADLYPELHNSILVAPTSVGTLTDPALYNTPAPPHNGVPAAIASPPAEPAVNTPAPSADFAADVAQAVSVAAAYFEDTLAATPSTLLVAGSVPAARLQAMLNNHGWTEADGLRVRDLVDSSALATDSVSARVPRSMLGGVMGALRG